MSYKRKGRERRTDREIRELRERLEGTKQAVGLHIDQVGVQLGGDFLRLQGRIRDIELAFREYLSEQPRREDYERIAKVPDILIPIIEKRLIEMEVSEEVCAIDPKFSNIRTMRFDVDLARAVIKNIRVLRALADRDGAVRLRGWER